MEKRLIKDGVIHCHTHHSLKDSALLVEELVQRASELGAPAVTLTDHGTMLGVDDFMTACEKYNIKGIPGVEAYYQEDNNNDAKTKREHIILLPRNNDGLTAIWQIVTDSNKRIVKGFPRINMEILHSYLDEGKIGHNNVICQSACMGGIIASTLLESSDKLEQIDKIQKNLKKCPSPEDKSYKINKEKLKELEVQISELINKKADLQVLAKRPFKKKEKVVENALAKGDLELYEELKKSLEIEKQETEQAAAELVKLASKLSKLSKAKTELNAAIKDAEEKHKKWHEYNRIIKSIQSSIKTEEELYEKAKEKAILFEELFGKGNFYIELQYHGIKEEAYVMPLLAKIARELNIPVVAANDVHIKDNSKKSLMSRQLMRSLRFNEWEDMNVGDDQLYMKTDEELRNSLLKILPEDIVEEAMFNIGTVISDCNPIKEKADHYPKFVSDIIGENSNATIERYCRERIGLRYPNEGEWTEEHEKRLQHELKVITSMGYSDYHLIVQDFLNFGRKLGKVSDSNLKVIWKNIDKWSLEEYLDFVDKHSDEAALSIGPGRGSAAGSIVCYLLGITSIDPMRYGLLFERFLNPERVSMPDIDSDFSPRVRDLVIEYVKKKYGENSVCCIATKGQLKPRAAIRSAARVLSHRDTGETKTYLSLADEIAKSVPNEVGMSFAKCKEELKEKYASHKVALEIIENAELIENRLQSIGMHAAGVIISDGCEVSKYVPLMWDDKNNRWKSQCDMVQAEARGLLKMDFLGLRNLDIITDALRLIKDRTGVEIDIERVPFEDNVFQKIYSTGLTNSVFQFESGGMKSMLKQFKPDSIEDIILLVAAYRPGPMQYLDKIIRVKHGKEKISYITDELEPILKTTYGSIIYQEQVQQIFRDLAGYSLGQADLVRRAMSKKKESVIENERKSFIHGDSSRNIPGCVKNGIDANKANQLFDEMMDFAKYAFNKSHAAAYAIVSYMTAWLKCNYPTEYMCAVMTRTVLDKIPGLIADCHTFGIEVLPPNINESSESFSIKDSSILFGLGVIKNVGASSDPIIEERKVNGKFISLKDFVRRFNVKINVLTSLIDAGAFDSFGKNRFAMNYITEDLKKHLKRISEKKEILEMAQKELKIAQENLEQCKINGDEQGKKEWTKKINAKTRQINNAELAIEDAELNFTKTTVPVIMENTKERLAKEKAMIGVYVSEHPLDSYPSAESLGTTSINDLEDNKNVSVLGIITNLRKTVTKKDKKPMAFFTLEDKTGMIDVNCFSAAYDEFGEFVEEDSVVIIEGRCFEEQAFGDQSDEETETIKKINVKSIKKVKAKEKTISLHIPSLEVWNDEISKSIQRYITEDGYKLIVYDEMLNEYRETNLYVSYDIVYNNLNLNVNPL